MRRRFWIAAGACAAVTGTVPAAEPAADPLPVHLERVDVDLSFGEGGALAPDVAARLPMEGIDHVRIDSLGRIVVAGVNLDRDSFEWTPAVARLLADGSLDPAFGAAGVAVLPLTEWISGLVVDPLDRVVAVGGFRGTTLERVTAVRLTGDGVPDTSFSGDGFFVVEGDSRTRWSFPTVLADGSLVAVGTTRSASYLVRLTEAGELDASFGADGTVPIGDRAVEHAAADARGSVVVVLTWSLADEFGAWPDPVLVRYSADGEPDPSFGTDGRLVLPDGRHFVPGQFDFDRDGRIVTLAPGSFARLLPDGTPDVSFSEDGVEDLVFGVPGYRNSLAWKLRLAPHPADAWIRFGSFRAARATRGWFAQFVSPASPRSIASHVARDPDDAAHGHTEPLDVAVAPDGATAVVAGRTHVRDAGQARVVPFLTRLDLVQRRPVKLPDLRVRWISASIAAAPEGVALRGTVRVENHGPARSTVGFVGFEVEAPDGDGSLVDRLKLRDRRVKPLAPGASTIVRMRRAAVAPGFVPPETGSMRLVAQLSPSGLHGHRGADVASEPLRERPRARTRRRGE